MLSCGKSLLGQSCNLRERFDLNELAGSHKPVNVHLVRGHIVALEAKANFATVLARQGAADTFAPKAGSFGPKLGKEPSLTLRNASEVAHGNCAARAAGHLSMLIGAFGRLAARFADSTAVKIAAVVYCGRSLGSILVGLPRHLGIVPEFSVRVCGFEHLEKLKLG